MRDTMIPGYTYGTGEVPPSPVSLGDFELMKKTVMFGEDDARYLRMSYDLLQDHVEEILDIWYGFVAANPQLLATFSTPDGKPIDHYLAAVRERFEQWILDTAKADYDQAWLDYQYEIGLRHHRTKKNKTDQVESMDIVPFRYLFLLAYPITFTLKPFLSDDRHSDEDVQRMSDAWLKSVLLQVTLWSQPYVKPQDY